MQPHHAQNNCLLISHIFASFLGCPLTVLSKSIEIEHLSIISENQNFQLVYDVYFSESIDHMVCMGGRGIRTKEDGDGDEEELENELREAEAGREEGWLSADELPPRLT